MAALIAAIFSSSRYFGEWILTNAHKFDVYLMSLRWISDNSVTSITNEA